MTISTGDRLPSATFLERRDGVTSEVTTESIFAGRRVALFAVPGAFTPTCHSAHVPSFIRTADAFRAKGVDDIACVAVNDPFVLEAWGEATGATEAGIRMLSDASATFTKAMGLAFDAPGAGFVSRSQRYALLAEDGVVRVLNLETSRGECEISGGEALLAAV